MQQNMKVELKGLDEVLMLLHPKAYQKALNRTVNEMGRKVKTQSTKQVRKTYNIKAAKIKGYMETKLSRYDDMTFQLSVNSKRRNVMSFSGKKMKKKGYMSVNIKKGNGRKKLRNAFLAKNKKAILHRVEKTQKVEAVQTLSIPQMFNKKILKEADDLVHKEFGTKLKDNFDFYIGKV